MNGAIRTGPERKMMVHRLKEIVAGDIFTGSIDKTLNYGLCSTGLVLVLSDLSIGVQRYIMLLSSAVKLYVFCNCDVGNLNK